MKMTRMLHLKTLTTLAVAGSWLAVGLVVCGLRIDDAQMLALMLFGLILILMDVVCLNQREQRLRVRFAHELDRHVQNRTAELIARNRQLEELSQRLAQLANTDPLTELPNRRKVSQSLKSMLARSARDQQPLSLAVVDVDHFKLINDRYGHDTGDRVLRHIAESINALLRPTDMVGRWGGEEFLILLPNINREDTEQICSRIRKSIKELQFEGVKERISISIGIASRIAREQDVELIGRADEALYQAKFEGRDRVMFAN